MDRKTESKSQPWWVIFLIIPILISSTAFTPLTSISTVSNISVASIGTVSNTLVAPLDIITEYLWKVVVSVGGEVIESYAGKFIEKVFDQIGGIPGYVILDSGNPLHGTFSEPIEFDITDPRTYKHRVIKLELPTVDWHPETSTWELDSKSKQRLREMLRKTPSVIDPPETGRDGKPLVLISLCLGLIPFFFALTAGMRG